MTHRSSASIAPRKQPRQARSADLVAAVLDAAVSVLAKEGAQRFTVARVAERAGVSVGSIYQYFPNKAAILFRLQSDEWRSTTVMLRDMLGDTDKPPNARLRAVVHAFLRSECEEAAMRVALADAAPLYRGTREAKQAGHRTLHAFMQDALPVASEATRELAGELITTTMSVVAKRFSETPREALEISAYADAIADMFCAYLDRLGSNEPGLTASRR